MPAVKHIECPCCGEDILETAKKCKHCGEWLDSQQRGSVRPSSDARSVTKGLKDKELHDFGKKALSFILLIIASIAGLTYSSWGVFIGIILVGAMLISWWYYRE